MTPAWIEWPHDTCPPNLMPDTEVDVQNSEGISRCMRASHVAWENVKRWRFRLAASGTEADVCNDIAKRQAHGISKYGVTVANNPLVHRQWLQHAYEEALDMAVYLKRAINQLDGK